jgi:hypothetical protein
LAYQVGIKDHTPKGGTEMPKIEELIPPKIFQEIQEKLREQAKKKPKKRRNRLKPMGRITDFIEGKR